ncbi:DUF6528 family protein [Paenibacillus nasutitermitis]|uniref:SLH domain-containing protein n=1 Tax=Paenibacillus nasutitermitis TaxID=1652958 RepID=A0A916ZCU8_9BACL|nr:DUF6528 family protein [Paenibacillus nasutitermitis]GGD88792.1 hypothetical protein GCM10010911_54210 [Paenibacillus nasutitermitis]
MPKRIKKWANPLRNLILLISIIVNIIPPITASAAEAVTSLAGNGTMGDPFKISNEAELLFAVGKMNASDAIYSNSKTYALTADIALTSNFPMINTFTGTFDGQGHKITGLIIEVDNMGGNVGFIKNASGSALIKDLIIENASVTRNFTSVIRTQDGILVGYMTGTGYISGVQVTGSITVSVTGAPAGDHDHAVGGIVGSSYTPTVNGTVIEDSFFKGTVKLESDVGFKVAQVGGIVGFTTNSILRRNIAMGDIYNNVPLNDNATYFNASLIAGVLPNNSTIENAVAYDGTIHYKWDVLAGRTTNRDIGSLFANIPSPLKGSNNLASEEIMMQRDEGSDQNPYRITTKPNTDTVVNSIIKTKTPSDLQQQATYEAINWDFDTRWKMDAVNGYPVLSYEENPDAYQLFGDGTAADPFQISNEEELLFAVERMNDSDATYRSSKAYALTSDIALTQKFPMIDSFSGVLDGRGHKITGLTIVAGDTGGNVGFIRTSTGSALIKDLIIEGASVTRNFTSVMRTQDGILVGYLGQTSRVSGVQVTGSITVSVTGASGDHDHVVGGIVGSAYTATVDGTTIEDSLFNGTVKIDGDVAFKVAQAGGIVGNTTNSIVRRNIAMGDIYNDVTPTATATYFNASLIAGVLTNNSTLENNVAYDGTIHYKWDVLTGRTISRDIGSLYGNTPSPVKGSNNLASEEIMMQRDEGSDQNPYRITTKPNIENVVNSIIMTKTPSDLQLQATYEAMNWDFDTRWKMDAVNGYPVLKFTSDISEHEEPLYTIAAFSDMHIDYGLQNNADTVRAQTRVAMAKIKEEENPDVVVISGDSISTHGSPVWDDETFDKVTSQMTEAFRQTSKDGKVLYTNGNHDYEVGLTQYNSGAYIDAVMQADVGEYADVLYEDAARKSNLMAYHYEINGIHFIGINTPYNGDGAITDSIYTPESVTWVENILAQIGQEQPVIVMGHYGFLDSRGLTPNYGLHNSNGMETKLRNILLNYPNLLYIYGHDHGGPEQFIERDTYERVTSYNADGSIEPIRNTRSSGFVSSFAGSLSYYNNRFNAGWLSAAQPLVVQSLMIYVYADHYELQMKNYGQQTGPVATPRSYKIPLKSLIHSPVYTIDRGRSIVTNIAHKTTISDFIQGFDNADEIKVFDVAGTGITDTSRYIRSDMTVKRIVNGAEGDSLRVLVNKAAPDANGPYPLDTVPSSADTEMVVGTDQKDNKIVVYKQNSADWNDSSSVVWSWKPTAAEGFRNIEKYTNVSDAKLRYSDFYGGYVVITTASGGFVGVIDYETGESLYSRNIVVENNPHSIELLPDGNMVVASSTGNTVTLYAASQGDSSGYYSRLTLPGAHGVTWDPKRNVLWAIGDYQVVGYEITGTMEQPILTPREDLACDLPFVQGDIGAWGHDLYPVYGNSDLFWVVTGDNVFQFNAATLSVTSDFEGYDDIYSANIKSIGNQPFSGTIIRAVPNGILNPNWNTDKVDLYQPDGQGGYTHEQRIQSWETFYKARVWYYAYQKTSENPDFVPVGSMTNVPMTTTAGVDLTLTGTVNPLTSTNKTVVWSVKNAGTTGATISGSILSTTTAGVVTVTATVVNGATASTNYTQDFDIMVIAAPSVTNVSVSPAMVEVQKGGTQNFNAIVTAQGGAPESVIWSVYGNHAATTAITNDGTLTIASDETATPLTVTATSVFDGTKYGTGTVTVTETAVQQKVISVTVSPSTTSVQNGQTKLFTAVVAVQGGAAQTVTWEVSGNNSGSTTITDGLLTVGADETAETLTVTARSDFDGTRFGTATVTVTLANKILQSIVQPANITGLTNGTPKMAEAFGLPSSVTLVTYDGNVSAAVNWDVASSSYNQFSASAQTFTVNGTVTLPSGVTNPENVGLSVTVTVSINARSDTPAQVTPVTYTVTASAGANGSISPSGAVKVTSGASQTFTIKANDGYKIAGVTADGQNIGIVSTFTFHNVTDSHSISASFVKDEIVITDPGAPTGEPSPFDDVNESAWYYDDVAYVFAHGLMKGTGENTFSPNMELTRGMIATTLGQHYGVDVSKYAETSFDDVKSDKYYAPYVGWVREAGIANGMGNNKFDPDAPITRQDLAVILMRYADFTGLSFPVVRGYTDFKDDADISSYARDAIETFFKAEIFSGKPGEVFDPKGVATRAEVAVILHRFLETAIKE